ncbi:heparan-alpha-glucosaminide N-acetyltransferase domain-containing protein [Calothrix sp. 336/3]|uniref:heparan-alpha-glucosaminide N-acetyltransferase domain-containing protein n=1 Tax=Calothrix sp. 336/3 TaxID=1337936 RepID=UPI0004E3B96B|nr:heparan-alpha-glucosaminide N-acetyltransferase domain-containing protein [Calothrix sp. 336/3]AKG23562.1 hypothetical protein IJ00_21790 [Calothrix sp. 336/3]
MKNRDYSLDMIKGIACILMLIAHSQMIPVSKILFISEQISGFAPVLFFAVAGVTATFQSTKKKIHHIILFYCFLGLLGISYNHIWQPQMNILQRIDCNILQIIAIGVITISIIEYFWKPKKISYLLLTIITFAIHYLFTEVIKVPNFLLTHFFFVGNAAGKTFPVFPWISLFFAGIFAYYIKNYWNLVFSIAIVTIFLCILYFYPENIILVDEKWQISTVYFLRAYGILFLTFYTWRKYTKYLYPQNFIVWLGQNSLLFLYVHFISVKIIFPSLPINNAYLIIIGCFATSIFMMQGVKYLNQFISHYFQNIYVWIGILIIILATPILLNNLTVIQFLELTMGIIFASNYQVLSQVIQEYGIKTIKHKN